MSKLQALKAASNINDVASLLGFKPPALSFVLYKQPAATKYKSFEIPKRNGGVRAISAPVAALKLVQKRLSDLLQDCLDEINAAKGRKDRIAHGFKRKRSIITNASAHRNRRYVFNVDLKDFFPGINFGRVRGYFITDRNFALNPNVATVLAQIACHDNSLPQGSPCSPVISNLITHVLDIHIVKVASRNGCTYSRYADDLTFSTNKPDFPKEIAVVADSDAHDWQPGAELLRLVKYCGFDLNSAKTRMQYRDSRQNVTGLVVNKKINVRREYRHTVRAMVHTLLKSGSFEHIAPVKDASGAVTLKKAAGTLNELHGMLGFIDSIDLFNQSASKERPQPSSKELMYRRFLLYREFYATERPVLICEGPTDNVYLTHAIRSLAPAFPGLATVHADKITIDIRIYKHSGTSTGRILGFGDGGDSSLTHFLTMYRKEVLNFSAPVSEHPVIVLYDNDSGGKGIKKLLKNFLGGAFNGDEPFVRVIRNLYALPTPPVAGSNESKIEDFFDAQTKGTELEGKTFSDGKAFDTTIHFGKTTFAHKVVRANADTINFAGFSLLLANIVAVLNHYAAAIATPPED